MAYLPWLESWAEWAMHEMPRTEQGGMQHMTLAEENHQQMWDDTLMMTVLPLAKIGKLLNRPQYVEATYQFLLHVQNLMDRETGLWFHGWNYEGRHNLCPGALGAGNSWLTMVIPDFLELVDPRECGTALSDYSPRRTDCRLSRMPDDSGLWHTLLDDPHSYLEASATAGFAYGILKAVRKRYVGQHYAGVAEKRFAGLCRIFRRRELLQTSFGTGMGSDSTLSPDPAYLDALRSGDGDPLSDGVSTQVLLSRAPRWRGAE